MPTVIHGVFNAGSGFRVCVLGGGGEGGFLFFRIFLLVILIFAEGEDWALGNNFMKFWDFPDVFLFPIILSATREATRVYHFITNNHTSFHLWWKENLLGLKKISEYYEHDCSLIRVWRTQWWSSFFCVNFCALFGQIWYQNF